MSQSILDDVVEIMTGILGLASGSLTLDSSMETVKQWDSLQHINVIMDVEQRFGIVLTPEEVMELHTVRSIVNIVQARLDS